MNLKKKRGLRFPALPTARFSIAGQETHVRLITAFFLEKIIMYGSLNNSIPGYRISKAIT